MNRHRCFAAAASAVILALSAASAWGQDTDRAQRAAVVAPLEEITTTATKKSDAEAAQDVPVSVSVFSYEKLAALKVTDIEDLSYAMPNVALDGIGTGKGIANFSIRGLGVTGSISSIAPTVGVFVDGVYLGMNYGAIADTFDLEAVEVLRGPQGLLFGRNVTGGAVLLRSRRPGDGFAGNAEARVETGPEKRVSASVEGALVEGLLSARFSVQRRDDEGWFDNEAPGGGAVGEDETWLLRPVFVLTPTENLDLTLIYERGDTSADGPATQNRYRFSGFDFAIDEIGYTDIAWNHVILEGNRRVPFGGGEITNVLGWREVEHGMLADIDSTVRPVFHLFARAGQHQFSNELRYSGRFFDRWDLTVGMYYFNQDIRYRERRLLRETLAPWFGGDQDQTTWGVFTQSEVELRRNLALTLGVRYTYEEKDVLVATNSSTGPACAEDSYACVFDFEDGDSWRNITPKIGLQWHFDDRSQLYGHYTRGFRSGGYNLRNTSPTALPGPFDEEQQDSFETGFKSESADRRIRFNLAGFYNKVYDMQRQVTREDATAGGVVQVIANTADAHIYGVEAELSALLGGNLTVDASVGYVQGEYDKVRFDLDRDGSLEGDLDLDLPRLANLTFAAGATYRRELAGLGRLSLRFGYAYRDDAEITDDNRGKLDSGHLVDANIAYSPSVSGFGFTLYGRNLLNEALRLSDLDLADLAGSTYSPLKEGRVLGFEISKDF